MSTDERRAVEQDPGAPPAEHGDQAAAGDPALPGVLQVDGSVEAELRRTLANRGPEYRPRTHHLRPDGSPVYINRLIGETSPYLLQHAHNPVNFYPWGPEAIERARRERKPILLSIGYSTCHWCHVMERESFEDEEIAAYLNTHYVSIKVDREERPDLDDVYMSAVMLLTGRGGWPMTVLLTPDLQPFFGGTYFPPRDGVRGARRGFLSLIQIMHRDFEARPAEVASRAAEVSRAMQEAATPPPPGAVPTYESLHAAAAALATRFDPDHGGFGRAPKFPQPDRVSLLLRYHRRTGDEGALRMASETLHAMAAGGMHDQVGGGFHRYSTDEMFLVPHFEKMLYDNAQLASLYLEGFQATGEARFARVAESTLDYVLREMTHPEGGFYSATDADSDVAEGHQEEGYHFTWTESELNAALDPEQRRLLRAVYDVPTAGNFEGRIILSLRQPLAATAAELRLTVEALERELAALRWALYEARKVRPYPGRDEKVLASWNGLMISALAQVGFALGREDYLAAARRAADFLLRELRDQQGRLLRSYHDGRAEKRAYLEDHAFVIAALLDLFEATSEPRYLEHARALQAAQDAHFWDGTVAANAADAGENPGDTHGGYFTTADDHEALIVRDKPRYDNAVPSGNSVAAMNLLRLSELTGEASHRARAERIFEALASVLDRQPLFATRLLAALDRYLDVPLEVVIVGAEAGADAAKPAPTLLNVVRSVYVPNRSLVVVPQARITELATQVPLVQDKVAIDGKTTAYVCEHGRCQLPTDDPEALREQLRRVRPLPSTPPTLEPRRSPGGQY